MHDLGEGGGHGHDDFGAVYRLDNVTLTTIGVDVGSSTFHLMFARVHLVRDASRLSARYEVVEREVLWRSSIELTPYLGRSIDAARVEAFVRRCYGLAGLTPEEIDSGAVILTGEALRQNNARAIADAIALDSGRFVCVSAGHHLEAVLASHGSGAIEWSARSGARLLHVDIGGGTTKLSLIEGGSVHATSALTVGGRQIRLGPGREVQRTSAGARVLGSAAGVDVRRGAHLSEEDESKLVGLQCELLLAVANGRRHPLEPRLRLTRGFTGALGAGGAYDGVSFSGGVSEYLYGRESRRFDDLGAALGGALRDAIAAGGLPAPVVDPGEGIRATVIGASQCSVQLSGNTVSVSDPAALPIHNVPVIHPSLPEADGEEPVDSDELRRAIERELALHGLLAKDTVALALRWRGDPSYPRLAAYTAGLHGAIDVESAAPAILLFDEDVAASIGRLLLRELPLSRPLFCLDGLELSPFDHIDVGAMLQPSGVLPVVIKSLLFGPDRPR